MKKVLCSALVAIMLLCMTACGNNIAGRYNFHSMNMEGMEVTAESLEALGSEVEMYLELEKDGTGTMASNGEVVAMGWADGQIWPAEDPEDKAPFTVDGDTLTIEQEGIKMVFKK
jgi:hypothetical protein